MVNLQTRELEGIARISRESPGIARDKTIHRLSKVRKGQSMVVKLVGRWGKVVKSMFGDGSKEEGDEAFFSICIRSMEVIVGGKNRAKDRVRLRTKTQSKMSRMQA